MGTEIGARCEVFNMGPILSLMSELFVFATELQNNPGQNQKRVSERYTHVPEVIRQHIGCLCV